MNGKMWPALSVVAVVLVIAAAWHWWPRPVNPLVTGGGTGGTGTTDGGRVYDFDAFQQDLAARVLKVVGGNDFTVVVATPAYPVGTLLRAEGTVPADFGDCAPTPVPLMYPAGHLFPSYRLSSDTVLTANLGAKAVQGLGDAGVDLEHVQSVQYSIENAQVQMMDDKSVDSVTGAGACGSYLKGHPGMRLIRGTVMGKMTFTVKVDNPGKVKASLAKLGGLSVQDNPDSSVLSVSDDEPQAIVELLSEFKPVAESSPGVAVGAPAGSPGPAPASASPAPRPEREPVHHSRAGLGVELASAAGGVETKLVPEKVQKTTTLVNVSGRGGAPHIFVQQDVADAPDAGTKVAAALASALPDDRVEQAVEKVASAKMPGTAQVRFANSGDVSSALAAVAVLRRSYPDARAVRLGLAAPAGQLEVWLPRVK